MNTAVTVERKVPTRDVSGGPVENFEPVVGLTDLPACVQPRRGRAFPANAQRQVAVTHVVYMLDASAVLRGDRLYQPSTGKRFLTHGPEDMGGQGRCWRVECTEVT